MEVQEAAPEVVDSSYRSRFIPLPQTQIPTADLGDAVAVYDEQEDRINF